MLKLNFDDKWNLSHRIMLMLTSIQKRIFDDYPSVILVEILVFLCCRNNLKIIEVRIQQFGLHV